MGVGELNNCYEDAELADTIFAVGTNAYETQTNYFLNHWIPNLRGLRFDKKKQELPGETYPPARIVIVDPRRTSTVSICEAETGKDRVLHLAVEPGTDMVLFNALLTDRDRRQRLAGQDLHSCLHQRLRQGGYRQLDHPG
jgi:arsenite oxidase large subunit